VYYDVPGQETLMTPEEIQSTLDRGAQTGCKEALMTFGDTPDTRYEHLYARLKQWGYGSLHDYHLQACEWALDRGLLPHSNPGDMSWEQMRDLKEVNVSMGVMLETTADIPAHAGKRRKTPGQRLQTLEFAGRLKVPFTTGLLIGIGESWEDRAIGLLAIKKLQEAYGHIQEVIIQNVVPNKRWKQFTPDVETMQRMVAMARSILPSSIEIQVPPNLAPIEELLDCGIGDLGGVSPVTDDYINPDYAWPQIKRLESLAAQTGRRLEERLAVYAQYLEQPGWLSPRMASFLKQEQFQHFGSTTQGVS
jgi:FO synthase subunit 1